MGRKGESGVSDLLEIIWFLVRFALWFIAVGLMAWGAGLLLRWLNRR